MQENIILYSIILTTAVLCLSLAIGIVLQTVICYFQKERKNADLFWQVFSGFLFLTGCYAIFVSKGLTVLLPVPLLAILLLKSQLKTQIQTPVSPRQSYLFFVCSILFHLLFFSLGFVALESNVVNYVTGDLNIYFRIAEHLNRFGIESNNLDPVYVAKTASVYHYGDIWLYALIAKINANPSVVFISAFTVLASVFVLGIYTYCAEKFSAYLSGKSAYLFLLLFAGLFSGFAIFFPTFILQSDVYTSPVLNYPKILLPACLFVGMMILVRSKDWNALVWLAIIGALCFVNIVPAMFMAIFLTLSLLAFSKVLSWKKWLTLNASIVLISAGFIVLFYKIIAANGHSSSGAGSGMTNFINAAYITTAIKIFVGAWFQLSTILPFLVLLLAGAFLSRFRSVKQIFGNLGGDILFLFMLIFSGIVCWAILHPLTVEAVQFYSNVLFPVIAIIISLIVCCVLFVFNSRIVNLLSLATLLICLYSNMKYKFSLSAFEKSEWVRINSFLHDDNHHLFVGMRAMKNYKSLFDKNTMGFIPLSIINYKWPDYNNLSLNTPFIPVDHSGTYAEEESRILDSATYSIYYKKQFHLNPSFNRDSAVINFLKENRIQFFTISLDTVLPFYLEPFKADSLVLKNAHSIIYRLNVQ